MTDSLRIVVAGLIAQYPLGGVTWDYIQYVVGLKRLGHDVYYIENSGQWPYNPSEGGTGHDPLFSVAYLSEVMEHFGLDGRWAYRFPGGPRKDGSVLPPQWFGIPDRERASLLRSADLVLNVSGGLGEPNEYDGFKRLAYVDTDPVFTQVKLAKGEADLARRVNAHDVHFSYGELLSEVGPHTGHRWLPLRKPIVLSEWHSAAPARSVFTTVMNWTSYKNVVYDGQNFGQKDVELLRFLDLPRLVEPTGLEIALASGKTKRPPLHLLAHRGWGLADPNQPSRNLHTYRDYLQSSKAEFTVAKHGYVVGRAGWFSGRSACYLAAGRPVVVQDTGFARVIPTGKGLLQFAEIGEAVEAIREVEANYPQHSDSALQIADEYFNSDNVLTNLLESADAS